MHYKLLIWLACRLLSPPTTLRMEHRMWMHQSATTALHLAYLRWNHGLSLFLQISTVSTKSMGSRTQVFSWQHKKEMCILVSRRILFSSLNQAARFTHWSADSEYPVVLTSGSRKRLSPGTLFLSFVCTCSCPSLLLMVFVSSWMDWQGTLVQVYKRLALVVAMENENAESWRLWSPKCSTVNRDDSVQSAVTLTRWLINFFWNKSFHFLYLKKTDLQ